MTRSELLEVVYRFYPQGVPCYDPALDASYDTSEEHRRLVAAAQHAREAYPKWKAMITRLAARYRVHNESLHLLAGGTAPAYSARIYLPGDDQAGELSRASLSFHVCVLGPYYGVHRGGPGGEGEAAAISQEIEATYSGYASIPPEIGDEVVPDVSVEAVRAAETTIYVCLFSHVWLSVV